MNTYKKSFLALILGLVTILGAAGAASARWGGHGGGNGCGGGYGAMQAPSAETQKLMEASYNTIAPLALELRAKQDELTAKIYSGADAKSIEALTQDINKLQAQVTGARVAMQQQFAKAGVPIHHAGRGNCLFGSGGMHRWHGGPCLPGTASAPAPQGE